MNTDRIKRMIELRKEGKTQGEIAKELGVSRQRLQQIAEKEDGELRELFRRRIKPLIENKCVQCEKSFTSKYIWKRFCSERCVVLNKNERSIRLGMPESILFGDLRGRKRWLYQNDPATAAIHKARMARYLKKIYKDPVKNGRRLEMMRAYMRKRTKA